MNGTERQVIETLKVMPNLTREEIADLNPDKGKADVFFAVQRLKKRGLLAVGAKPSPRSKGRRTVQTFTIQDEQPKVVPLVSSSDELQELRAWKAAAIERYPDLAVEPVVLEARRIAAQFLEGPAKADVLAGKKDECPIMRATVEALERGRA